MTGQDMTYTEKCLMFYVGVRVKVRRSYLPGGFVNGTITEVTAPFESPDIFIYLQPDTDPGLPFMSDRNGLILFLLDGRIEVING
jgi:hypothetical protein